MIYEFKDSEAKTIKVLGNKIAIFGILMMITAIAGILQEVFIQDQPLSSVFGDLLGFLFLLLSGFLLFRPSDNIRNIANTKEHHIKELIDALKEFNLGFLIAELLITYLAVISVVALISSLFIEFALSRIFSAIVFLLIGLLFFYTIKNFRNVTKTLGNDIEKLMSSFKKLDIGFTLILILSALLPLLLIAGNFFKS